MAGIGVVAVSGRYTLRGASGQDDSYSDVRLVCAEHGEVQEWFSEVGEPDTAYDLVAAAVAAHDRAQHDAPLSGYEVAAVPPWAKVPGDLNPFEVKCKAAGCGWRALFVLDSHALDTAPYLHLDAARTLAMAHQGAAHSGDGS